MKGFADQLEKEIDNRLKVIEKSNLNVLKKSLEASLVLGDAFQRLGDFFKGIAKWAKLSGANPEQCFAIYNGEKNMKTSAGEIIKW